MTFASSEAMADIYMEAQAALAEEPLISTTLSMLPPKWRSMVDAALVVAFCHGYVQRESDKGDMWKNNPRTC